MDTRVLTYFLTVAREENITRAAEILRISQPSLSRQIMQLEEELGLPLFIRGNKNVRLTPEGLLFKSRAEEILSLVDKTREELLNEKEYIAGDIYIGTMESEAFLPLADLISQFSGRYPNVCFHIMSNHSTAIARQVEQGLVDFGFLMGPVNQERFRYFPAKLSEVWGALIPGDHPLAGQSQASAGDLLSCPLIVPQRILDNGAFSRILGRPQDYRITATYNLISNVMTLVEAGMGAALCLYRKEYGARGLCFLPLSPRRSEDNAYVVWKKDHVFSQATSRFAREICDSFSELQTT